MLTEHVNILVLMEENEKQGQHLPGAEYNSSSSLCSSERLISVVQ